ncbi:flagellar basal-body MS-ring/collar protein FliF [Erythrobacter sp. F6033]|uniref:flagellar basal-body MS-ring/collar protein FliF n=1 Tax=Erythrobacter sp. F6033 TaxID=2926401 RepID=UPI001FF2A065|nr:flagellar basal-body MS-ring/collar protein FliF [Erythrobacter sp. F6033]MCK0129425.1 flagellar M-ring protein FliF [Erythrobacter sp. F6033]
MADATMPVPAGGEAIPVVDPTIGFRSQSGDWRSQISAFISQPAIRRALPALAGLGAIAIIAALYFGISQGPQRILYSNLSDGERAKVVETLEQSGIGYTIDSGTGVVTVGEDELYRARMAVASDAGLAAPEGASEMLDAIPLGSSRTLEGERLRLARERELMLTIREIDGIEAVRVHLATPERSVFVRDTNAPTASVMVRLVGGRSLGQDQVEAIVNLVSGSVPGMTPESVRVVDQNGRLLSSARDPSMDGLVLQREFESKLRQQVTSLLMPLLGDGNFSSQVQVELDQSEVTAARESYDQDGVVRSESERSSMRSSGARSGGVPGVTANTPPPDAALVDEAPQATEAAVTEGAGQTSGDRETATRRDYELGREVAVTSTRPGGLVKLSVAVAVSDEALKAAAPLTAEQLQSLVSAAVGADEARGDQVEVVTSTFETAEVTPVAFYEQPWFAMALRYGTALLAVLLVLLMVVRPLMKRLRNDDEAEEIEDDDPVIESGAVQIAASQVDLPRQVDLARQLASSQPDRAVEALQRMLQPPKDEAPVS